MFLFIVLLFLLLLSLLLFIIIIICFLLLSIFVGPKARLIFYLRPIFGAQIQAHYSPASSPIQGPRPSRPVNRAQQPSGPNRRGPALVCLQLARAHGLFAKPAAFSLFNLPHVRSPPSLVCLSAHISIGAMHKHPTCPDYPCVRIQQD